MAMEELFLVTEITTSGSFIKVRDMVTVSSNTHQAIGLSETGKIIICMV